MTLYEVSSEYLQLIDEANTVAEENEGIIPDELSDKIDALTTVRTDKIKNCIHAYKNILAEADAIKNEKDALTAREKFLRRKTEWLEGYIRYNVLEGEVLSAPTYEIKWRKSTTIEIIDIEKVPEEFLKITKEPIKKDIKQAIKDGEDVSEYATVINHNNMSIK